MSGKGSRRRPASDLGKKQWDEFWEKVDRQEARNDREELYQQLIEEQDDAEDEHVSQDDQ